ncbi:hypothetical protein ETR14_27820 (plasmid) [Sphingosinicella sp. BN140058]|nr:hypothetical protein ETR14_27820 [Sphingosinicella sp. BN140058]
MPITDPMNVSRFGIDVTLLRTFLRSMLRYPQQTFTTPEAMASLRLAEPAATETLLELARARWLVYLGVEQSLDQWKVGRLGLQFSMKQLTKRMPVREANQLLDRAIEAAKAFNRTDVSTRIERIALFGSLARGGDENGTVGDIDLQVTLAYRRDISAEEREALVNKEAKLAPKSRYESYQKRTWVYQAGIRALRAIGSRLTVSTHDNIRDMGCEHRIVYVYDGATGNEPACDRSLVPADATKQATFNADEDHHATLPALPPARPAPPAPKRVIPSQLRSQVDRHIAQYHWVRGLSLAEIAPLAEGTPSEVQAALASAEDPIPNPDEVVLTACPVDALAPFLAGHPEIHARIRIDGGRRGSSPVGVHLRLGSESAYCGASMTTIDCSGAPALTSLAEVIARAAARWQKRLVSKMKKAPFSLSFTMQGEIEQSGAGPSPLKEASALAERFRSFFDARFAEVPFSFHKYRPDRSLSIELDLLRLKLVVDDGGGEAEIPLGVLADTALPVRAAFLGAHASRFERVEIRRFEHVWGPRATE